MAGPVRGIDGQMGYGYNNQTPGPVLVVAQGSHITVDFQNQLPEPTTVHWHGLRQDNADDGVPNMTQPEVMPGGNFIYNLSFPDEGLYWYHPHVREDRQQNLGLYGLIWVKSANASAYEPVGHEEMLVLADHLSGDWGYGNTTPNFAIMGRYGDQMVVNGRLNYTLHVKAGETVRWWVLDAANVRPFNLSMEGAELKVVGSDNGRYVQPFWADSVVLSPSERAIVETRWDKPGTYNILNVNPLATWRLGQVIVEPSGPNDPSPNDTWGAGALPAQQDVNASIEPFRPYFDQPPDFTYKLEVEIPGAMMGGGMMMMDHDSTGIEWEDTMFGMNRLSTGDRLTWKMVDAPTGLANMDISHQVPVGKIFKIRIENDPHSVHPMQHSIHLHGARFLVVKVNDRPSNDLAWKDTVDVPTGGSVELLAEFPNPGEWMFHCHIAEHLGSGMMTTITAVKGS